MLLIAHRCGTDRYPELSLESSKLSLELGADYVEMDIRFTKDNVPVISHDEDALRLFGNPAKINELSAEQFSSLCYVDDHQLHPHTLEEVLSSDVAPILFHIKEGGERLTQILACIRKYGYEDKVIMGVMTSEDVRNVKQFNRNVQVLAFMPSKDLASEFIANDADVIRLWERWVDEEAVRIIHEAGKQVWVMAGYKGTVGYTSPENLLGWKRMGINGVLVDKVEETKSLLMNAMTELQSDLPM
jgi:glycerophosphoryl diester phosphodiesterase